MLRIFALFFILVIAASLAHAQPHPANCLVQFQSPPANVPVVIMISPLGGTPLTEAFDPGGAIVDASIKVTLYDNASPPQPVGSYPPDAIRLQCADGAGVWCDPSFFTTPAHAPYYADHATNSAGETTFSLEYYGLTCNRSGLQVEVEVAGVWLPLPGVLPIETRGADGSGDGDVDLTDITEFSQSIVNYDACYDLNNDGTINLSDITRYRYLYGPLCPLAP